MLNFEGAQSHRLFYFQMIYVILIFLRGMSEKQNGGLL